MIPAQPTWNVSGMSPVDGGRKADLGGQVSWWRHWFFGGLVNERRAGNDARIRSGCGLRGQPTQPAILAHPATLNW